MTLSFIDASVLIAATQGTENLTEAAVNVLSDPDRLYAASIYIKLETLPKAVYRQRRDEIKVYNAYFDAVSIWAMDWEAMHKEAERQANIYGIGAMDALHVAAALLIGADEFVTAEREGKSLFRTPDIRVISIRPKPIPNP